MIPHTGYSVQWSYIWQYSSGFRKEVSTLTPGTKNEVVGAIVADEGIPFYCCLVAVNMETRTVNRLLHAIVELWVTIRGFSFCSGWMELYKQETKSFQRSKGLHKALFTDNT